MGSTGRSHDQLSHSTTWPPQPVATAGFGIRTMAYLVDAVLLSFVGGAFPYLVIANSTTSQAGNVGQQVTTSTSGSILVSLVYFVILWSRLGGGRTLGMRLLGLKVIQERDGASPEIGTALIRWLGLWLSFAVCFVGVIWVAFDSRHQGWHDKIARTLVVRT
ncbi:MAG TPA: RDD family protein [Candidatus Dormibacteraeota bacterium]